MNPECAGGEAFGQPDLRQHLAIACPQTAYALKSRPVLESHLPAARIKLRRITFNRRIAELVQVEFAPHTVVRFILNDDRSASVCDRGTRGVIGVADDAACRYSVIGLRE